MVSNHERLRTMHLFAGVGGGILADLILGHEPIVAVEWDRYACRVLRERVADGWFEGMSVWEGDVTMFDPSDYKERVDCIHAGFPCQDISVAGNQAGVGEDTRSGLYREVLRIADEVRPDYIFLENVAAIVSGDGGGCSEPLPEILPREAMMRSGYVYPLPKLGQTINVTVGGYWATPRANKAMSQNIKPQTAAHPHSNLETVVARQMWATPTAHLAKEGGYPAEFRRDTNLTAEAHRSIGSQGGGKLNPTWVEWLMGFPLQHTASRD